MARQSPRTRPAFPARRALRLQPLEDRSVPAAFADALGVGGASQEWAKDVAADAAGYTYVTGHFATPDGAAVDFDPRAVHADNSDLLTGSGGMDVFVAKYSPAGALVWARALGGASGETGEAVTVDGSGNVYVTGYFNGPADFDPGPGTHALAPAGGQDLFVAKLNADGTLGWARGVGTAGQRTLGFAVAVDSGGNAFTTGYAGPLDNAADTDIIVTRHNADGTPAWVRRVGGSILESGKGIAVDGSSNAYVTGTFHGTVDFDPGAGTYNLYSGGRKADPQSAAFVLKLDAGGKFGWARHFQAADNWSGSFGTAIGVDPSGAVFAAGTFWGTVDFDPGKGSYKLTAGSNQPGFVCKLDAAGKFAWVRNMGGSVTDMVMDGAGGVYLTGEFSGTADFDPEAGSFPLTAAGDRDAYALKLDAGGTFAWAVAMGGAGYDKGEGIAVDGSGNVYLTGFFEQTAVFGDAVLSSAGGLDMFWAKLTQP